MSAPSLLSERVVDASDLPMLFRTLDQRAPLPARSERVANFDKVFWKDSLAIASYVIGSARNKRTPIGKMFARLHLDVADLGALLDTIGTRKSSALSPELDRLPARDAELCCALFRLLRTRVFLSKDVNTRDAYGFTRLSMSAAQGDFLSCYMLLSHGADPHAKSKPCFTRGPPGAGQLECFPNGADALQVMVCACNRTCRCFGMGCVHEVVGELLRAFHKN